ncbi:MAG: zinc ribbon domain-containing protein [Methylococcaceae bacterium]
MPIYELKCPKCNHVFKGLVIANTKVPKEWVCSQCGSHEAKPIHIYENIHPLEDEHTSGCPCCGGASRNNF